MSLENESKNISNNTEIENSDIIGAKDMSNIETSEINENERTDDSKKNGIDKKYFKMGIIGVIALLIIAVVIVLIIVLKNNDSTENIGKTMTDKDNESANTTTPEITNTPEISTMPQDEPPTVTDSPKDDINPIPLEEYSNLITNYNESVQIYNKEIDNYNAVVEVVLKEKANAGIEYLPYMEKQLFDESNNTQENADKLTLAIADCNSEIEVVKNNTEKIELDFYNDFKREYNNEVDKYKNLISKITKQEGFDASIFVFGEKDYMRISGEQEWITLDEYSLKLRDILDEKEIVEQSYPIIYYEVLKVIIDDYNTLVPNYNNFVQYVSLDFIEDFPNSLDVKNYYSEKDTQEMTMDAFFEKFDKEVSDLQDVVARYNIMYQIKQASEDWVIDKLRKIDEIQDIEAVSFNNDPNGLLGKDHGYSACVYFTLKNIDLSEVPGNTVVDKGTDGGGAIEVYRKVQDAKDRCEYLSQFNGTLLYSGSYTLVGTMVVRTTYLLTNEEQVKVVGDILNQLTLVE